MKRYRITLLLAVGHGLNDLVAGFFLGSLLHLEPDVARISLGLLVYNLLAFGGQYPAALWIEKYSNPKVFLLGASLLSILAVACFGWLPQLAIILAGVASAIYHVAGGTVCARQGNATHIGLFAAPGIAGLIIGGYLAYAQLPAALPLLACTILFFGGLYFAQLPATAARTETQRPAVKKLVADRHDLIMILLLTLISLRSVIWNLFQLIHENNYTWLFAIAAAAVAGKVAGGWLADRIGYRLYMYVSMLLATPLLTFFRNELLLFCIGIGLLQSGIPATTTLLLRSMQYRAERAIGLSFGTAIIAGALLFYTPVRFILSSYLLTGILIAGMLGLLYWAGVLQARKE